jgi:hypothetical protein
MTTERKRLAIWILVGAVGPIALAGALIPVRDEMASVNVALVLVLAVVAVARFGGRTAGFTAALSSTAAFGVLFTEPYGHLAIDSVDDIETTVLLAAVGLSVGSIAAKERYERARAESLVDEVTRVHRVSETIASGAPVEEVIGLVEAELCGLLGLKRCRFERPPFDSTPPVLDHEGRVLPVVQYRFHGEGFELPAEGVELAVEHRGRVLGRFVMQPLPDRGTDVESRLAAVVLADAVGVVLAAAPATRPS